MTIYLDILWIVNLYIDYFILLSVKDFLHLKTTTIKILIAAVLGASFSLISLLQLPNILDILLSVIFSIIICYIGFFKLNIFTLIKTVSSFLIASFIFSGIIQIFSKFSKSIFLVGTTPYFQISPILLFVFTILAYFISKTLQKIRGNYDSDINFCKIIVEHNGTKVQLFAKADTGSCLKEPFSGLSVIIAEKQALNNLNLKSNEQYRVVPYSSLGGSGLLSAFKPDKIYFKKNNKEISAYLAIYKGRLSTGSFDCLFNPEII